MKLEARFHSSLGKGAIKDKKSSLNSTLCKVTMKAIPIHVRFYGDISKHLYISQHFSELPNCGLLRSYIAGYLEPAFSFVSILIAKNMNK